MLVSTNLSVVPFISSTDATRLQMAAKQLSQTVGHPNCRVPYVIGSDWTYLRDITKLFRCEAEFDGEVLYVNRDLMIVLYANNTIKVLETPEVIHTSQSFGTKLRNIRQEGLFKQGDTLYEYDCFMDGVPSFGYNVNIAFMPFFGLNFEDSIVASESVSDLCRSIKTETILIPIYNYSLFKNTYPNSKYNFIPEENQSIKKNIVAVSCSPKITKNIKQALRSMNLYDFSDVLNDELQFNSNPVISKLKDAKIFRIKIHKLNSKINMIDKTLQKNLELMLTDYRIENSDNYKEIRDILGEDLAKNIMISDYIMTSAKEFNFNSPDLIYVLELRLVSSLRTKIGDKISNRYSNKGVISVILPDELRPINTITHEPIDVVLGPLSIFSRMNFGQVLEVLISKVIKKCEKEFIINQDPIQIHDELMKLAYLAKLLNDEKYSEEIQILAKNIKFDSETKNRFIESITRNGMYFECKGFVDLNISEIHSKIKELFNITTNDNLLIRKETFEYAKNLVKVNIDTPKRDIIYNNIFNGPMYIIKLKHLASSKLSSRDYGDYSSSTKQPIEDKYGRSRGSRLGYMEFDSLLAHNLPQTIREFRTVKSDSSNLKIDLINQMISSGKYDLPKHKTKSYTKLIIDSLVYFLNEN